MQNVVCFYRHHVGNCNCVQISRNTLQKAKYLRIFPKQIVRQIKKDTGVLYTESGIRDILHRHNFTPKVPDATHKNKATNEEVEEWQKSLKRWISCVKRDNFELHVIDETILLHDYVPKRGPWSPKGQKILRTYFGDHQRRVIYGAISDSHQYFLQKKKFDGPTFLKFVKKLLERSDKAAIVMDGASQHKTVLLANSRDFTRHAFFVPRCRQVYDFTADIWRIRLQI